MLRRSFIKRALSLIAGIAGLSACQAEGLDAELEQMREVVRNFPNEALKNVMAREIPESLRLRLVTKDKKLMERPEVRKFLTDCEKRLNEEVKILQDADWVKNTGDMWVAQFSEEGHIQALWPK